MKRPKFSEPTPRPAPRKAFRSSLGDRQLDPAAPWIGGYVAHEWSHARHGFDHAGVVLEHKRVLEFGCNMGATAIVLARLGALVDAVDVDRLAVEVAALNAAQYPVAHPICFTHLTDSAALPFPDGHFDVVVCNSVLE